MELEQTLKDCGCRPVGPAATVDQALRLARDEALDGAVLDVNLRDKPVAPVADELIRRGVQIIFATGYDDGYAFPEHCASLTSSTSSSGALCRHRRWLGPPGGP
jgi:hypothetical protein